MKVKELIVILFIAAVIIMIGFFSSRKNKGSNNVTYVQTPSEVSQTEVPNQTFSEEINLTESEMKKSVEKSEKGVEVSNVKLNSNKNNIVNVSLTVANKNQEEKNVSLRILYFDKNNNQIGENGFSVGHMDAGESKELDSTCYIENANVANIKAEITVEEIVKNENPSTNGESATGENSGVVKENASTN